MSREMKHSGIEWIGEIPKEWNTCRLKRICHQNPNTLSDNTEGDFEFEYVDIGSVSFEKGIFRSELMKYKEAPSRARRKACLGDVILSTVRTYLRAIDIVNTPKKAGYIYSTGFAVLTPHDNVNYNFLSYLVKNDSFLEQVSYLSKGINYPSINSADLMTIEVAYPSLILQQKIANYLDKVCGEVDEMIALQEQMIEELKAYKQSVITEAVTKGLNPNVPMKDSGIDWIGEVPEHWNLHQFRRIFEIKKIIAGALGYDVLSVTQNGIKVKDLTKNEGQIAQDYSKYQLVDVDDFVMNHMDLLTGFVDCSKRIGVTSPDYRVFKAIDKTQISLMYYLRIFQTCYKDKIFYHLGQGVSGMGRWRLPADQLKLFYLPIPPLFEQQSIASYLDTKCAEIDALIALKQAKIDELKEYKKSVIYEYVTGKKEVV